MKMETIVATEKGRQKWIDIAVNGGVDDGATNCALCQRFSAKVCATEDGEACPLKLADDYCCEYASTYARWHRLTTRAGDVDFGVRFAETDESKDAAWGFAVLIDSLLPVTHQTIQGISRGEYVEMEKINENKGS